ncbi:MAG: T9SS type A sorting domain-containing protein [Bacteroidota bacterium]|nr:T9SS type A sorting domain-containing protein [Bacteroidota bacterium]
MCFGVIVQAQTPFTFTSVRPDLTQFNYGSLAYADVDFDGDFDIAASGNRANRPPYVPYSFLARSDGDYLRGGHTPAHAYGEHSLGEGLRFSKVQWSDYDRDGRLDLFISGTAHSGASFDQRPRTGQVVLFRNLGGLSFASQRPNIAGLYGGSLEVADFDGDGDEDVFVTGFAEADRIESGLYENQRGRFVATSSRFEPVALGDAGWVDYDTDGDVDLLLSGLSDTGRFITKLYLNGGSGQFREVDISLPGLIFSSFDWGDYDNDGDPDLALSGAQLDLDTYLRPLIQIWRNDDGYLELTDQELAPILYGQVGWGDYDNDGALDLLVVGASDLQSARKGRIYRNEGGRFIERVALPGVASAGLAWGDYDQDLDLDILMAGTNLSFNPLTRLYRNDSRSVNSGPVAPMGLQAQVTGRTVNLSWEAGSDFQTPAPGLSYNLYVGTASGRDNILRAYSSIPDGRRLRPDRGNAGQALFWRLENLPADDYFWSVQAVDHGLIGSDFAVEGTFSVTAGRLITDAEADYEVDTGLMAGYPNPFRIGHSVSLPYSLREAGLVEIAVYNILGARVRQLAADRKQAGHHVLDWQGDDDRGQPLAPGTYFVRLRVAESYYTHPVVLTR